NLRAARSRVLEFFQNQRGCAFAHHKSVAQFVERPTGQLGIITATHRFNDVKRADRDRGQRRFGASGNNDIGEIVANVTERFANRYRSAGATVRIGGTNAAKSKIDRDVRMSRTAEYLHRQSGLNSARAFFPKTFNALANASDRAKAGDDNASSTHAATRLAFAST